MMAVAEDSFTAGVRPPLFKSMSNCGIRAPTYDDCAPVLTRGASDILEQDPDKIIAVINRGHLPSGSLVFQTVLKQMVEEQLRTSHQQNGLHNENGIQKRTQKPSFRRCQSEKSGMLTPRRQVRWANSERLLSPLPPHHAHHPQHTHHAHSTAKVKRSISEGTTHH